MKRRATKAKPAPHAPVATPAPVLTTRWRRVGLALRSPAFLLTLCVCVAAVTQGPLLHKLGLRACCLADLPGLRTAALDVLPSGLLRWCAELLSVLWAMPWLGGTLFLLLGLGVTWMGRRWARLGPVTSVLPFALVVGQVAYCGFSVWLFADATFPVLYLLIWGLTLFTMGLARRWGGRAAPVLAALYPLGGSATLMGGLAAAALPGQRLRARAAWVALTFALPVAWQRLSPYDPAWDVLLKANVPFLFEHGSRVWDTASALLFATLALAPWATRALPRMRTPALLNRLPARLTTTARTIGPAALFALVTLWAMDPVHPLYDLLACERALARGDMARILAVPEERVAAHRMLGAYRIHALWRAGELEERLFDVPWQVSHATSTIETMELDGYNLLYDYGIVQLARRWCYESAVNKGWSAPKLALLARIALVCDEPALARRYALQLRRIPLHRAEAETLLGLAQGTEKPTAALLRVANLHRRLCLDEGSPVFEGDKRLEPGIYNRYAVLKNGDRDMVALYLCASLLRKDLTPFIENYDVILRVWPKRPLPRAFQQGLLAAAATLPPTDQPRLTADLFSPGVPQAFADFQRLSPNANPRDPAFLRRFAHTFWFYAAFVP